MANNNLNLFQKGNKMGKGRPKGSRNRSTVAIEILNLVSKGVNPLTREEEEMSQEHWLYLSMLNKSRKGDVAASKLILDSAYGQAKEQIDVNADVPKMDIEDFFKWKD